MKLIIYPSRKQHWLKVSLAFLTCLTVMIAPSCQKDGFNQDSIPDMSLLASSKVKPTATVGKIKDVDGNWYKTVKIGNQWWMAENLRTTRYSDRTDIPNVTVAADWAALTIPAYCWYENDKATYGGTYGALYNWYVVDATSNGGKNVCPSGWHVPTESDFTALIGGLLGPDVAGGKLKETGTTHWAAPNAGATNETGFTAVGSGYLYQDGTPFSPITYECYFWSSTPSQYYNFAAYGIWLSYSNTAVGSSYLDKNYGFSVRCLMDN